LADDCVEGIEKLDWFYFLLYIL